MPDLIGGDGKLKEKHGAYFSFKHVQHIHFVEEKANEGLLVLRSNVAVIHELRDFYAEVATSLESTLECVITSVFAMAMFRRHLDNTAKDLVMQQARLQMLLQLLTDRRTLVSEPCGNEEISWTILKRQRDSLRSCVSARTLSGHRYSLRKCTHLPSKQDWRPPICVS